MNLKFFNKSFALMASGLVLCGCSGNKSSNKNSSVIHTSTVIVSTTTTKPVSTTTKPVSTTFLTKTTSSTTVTTQPSAFDIVSSSDNVILSHFANIGSDIKNSIDTSEFLDKGKSYFIYCVDFLFYDGEINGYKFSDLSEMAKQQLINDIITIDDLISSKFPNYKETISNVSSKAFLKASEIIHSGSTSISDYSREKLGEDNYNKINDYKDLFVEQTSQDWDEFKDIVGSGYEKGKSKIKEWYENYKEGQ